MRSKIKSMLYDQGISQREVLEECKARGIEASLSKINIALDDAFCKSVQEVARGMMSEAKPIGQEK